MKQRGITLIDLLIIIAILGVIAAVVALNVGGFFGTGGNETIVTNQTIFDDLTAKPIGSLNLTELNFLVDYCIRQANSNPDTRSSRWPIMTTVYQNQILINELQTGSLAGR